MKIDSGHIRFAQCKPCEGFFKDWWSFFQEDSSLAQPDQNDEKSPRFYKFII
jgi:hypothetical protein